MAVATKVSKVVPVSVPAAAPSPPSATSPATTSPLVVKSVKNATPGLGVQLLTAGTAACIADCITFPLDTVKVRLQVSIQILIKELCYVFEKILYFLYYRFKEKQEHKLSSTKVYLELYWALQDTKDQST